MRRSGDGYAESRRAPCAESLPWRRSRSPVAGRPYLLKGGPVSELRWEEIDERAVDTVRVLAADAVQ
jgi:transketolase